MAFSEPKQQPAACILHWWDGSNAFGSMLPLPSASRRSKISFISW